MNKANRRLTKKCTKHVCRFDELPMSYALAAARYMLDIGAWRKPRIWGLWMKDRPYRSKDQEARCLKRSLPFFRLYYGWRMFGMVVVSMKSLCAVIMENDFEGCEVSFKTFGEYHEYYKSYNPVPRHKGRWPVVLGDSEGVTLNDGYHRLHDYYRRGLRRIKCIYLVKKEAKCQTTQESDSFSQTMFST